MFNWGNGQFFSLAERLGYHLLLFFGRFYGSVAIRVVTEPEKFCRISKRLRYFVCNRKPVRRDFLGSLAVLSVKNVYPQMHENILRIRKN